MKRKLYKTFCNHIRLSAMRQLLRKLLPVPFLVLFCALAFGGEKKSSNQYQPGSWHRIESNETMPNTTLLDWQGDFGKILLDQAHRYVDHIIGKSADVRTERWNHRAKTIQEYTTYLETKRQTLSRLLGIHESRVPFDSPRLRASLDSPPVMMETEAWKMLKIEWDVFDDHAAQGILIEPKSGVVEKVVIALAHDGMCPKSYFLSLPQLKAMANDGKTRMVIPMFLNREVVRFKTKINCPRRELIYRQAYMLGRHLIGYEIETVRAVIDWVKKENKSTKSRIIVGGYGDGGMLALYCGALDERIDETRCAGYFGDRSDIWRQPLDRNVHGLLNEFGDAELGAMIFPRALVIEQCKGPSEEIVPETFPQGRVMVLGTELKSLTFPATRWAPGQMCSPDREEAARELARANRIVASLPGVKPKFSESPLFVPVENDNVTKDRANPSYQKMQDRILAELDDHSQNIMRKSIYVRNTFMKKLDTSSVEKLVESTKWYRDYFHDNIAGRFDDKRLPFRPQTRKVYDEATWVGYDVVLDVFDGLSAYGTLFMPKNLKQGEKRPVVVFQHGREGCPDNGINGRKSYNAVNVRLVESGYIVFCPQNLYIRGDEYRKLQQKCYAIGRTFFGLMIAQHEQIVKWLGSLPYVRSDKIGFYGISYGGKSAMFIPSVVTGYALSICCADFNERVVKCASTDEKFSFMTTPEYEMYEFDSADTFNYAEMAMLIAPRPFMVERGHKDGVGIDEYVAFEFARVARFYDLLPETRGKAVIEYFDGGHEVHFDGTAKFLDRFLKDHSEREPSKPK